LTKQRRRKREKGRRIKNKNMQDPTSRRKARITYLLLGTAVIVCLIFLMFAFVQKAAADKATDEAVFNRVLSEKMQHEASAQQKAAENHAVLMKQHLEKCEKVSATKDSIIASLRLKKK
jgi:hypothetical protein